MNFLTYCKQLKAEDWSKMVNKKWTVREIVAHMVGWEKAFAEELDTAWKTKKDPWFMDGNTWDDFNQRSIKLYNNYTPNQLLEEWEKWQKALAAGIKVIGEKELRKAGDQFDWVFDEWDPDEEGERSHQKYHLKQLKEILGQ